MGAGAGGGVFGGFVLFFLFTFFAGGGGGGGGDGDGGVEDSIAMAGHGTKGSVSGVFVNTLAEAR